MHISQKDAVCPKRCEGRVGGVLRGNGDRAAILPRRGEEATASGYGAGGPGGGLRAFVGSRGSGRPRKHGVADSCESAEPRTAARERRNAGGCRSLRLRTGTGMGGPQTAARAQGCGRPRKRGPRAAAKARSRRRPRGAEVTGSNGVSYNVSGRSGEAGLGVATAGRICRGSG